MSAPAEDIPRRLPHGPEFRFVSRVLELEPNVRALGLWDVSGTEVFFKGHFPGAPLVPGVLLAEALAQISGLVVGDGPGRGGRLAHTDMRFERAIVPPAEISLHSTLARRFGDLCQFDVEAGSGGHRAARGTITLSFASASNVPPKDGDP